MPKISVVVPFYNAESYLSRCLDSILKQTFYDFELILVDDGSKDSSFKICLDYKKLDQRINVIHKENAGLNSARLAGHNISNGKYIVFIDSDDFIHPEMLEKLYFSLKKNNSQISICSYFFASSNIIKPTYLPINKKILNKNDFKNDFILPIIGRIQKKGYINFPGFLCLRLFEKKVITKDCFVSERVFFTEDDIFNLLVINNVQKISLVNEPLYFYWQGLKSLTQNYRKNCWEMLLNRYFFCKEYCLEKGFFEEAKDRLDFALYQSLSFSLDNICKLHNFRLFNLEINEISSNKEVKKMLKHINIKLMSKSQFLLYILLKNKFYRLIYFYRILRLGV